FVAPILQTLILNRAPKETIAWANKVASWDFERIIPCHFDAPIAAGADRFRPAFSFLEQNSRVDDSWLGNPSTSSLPAEDFQLLKEIDARLCKFGIVPPPKDKI
ncbi:MAG: DUF4336 domain-containing protein, partial [Xenococcaceae cyanobacterium]